MSTEIFTKQAKHQFFIVGEIELMYLMCAFERYSFNRDDWCNFLNDNDRKIMEYRADLEVRYCKTLNTFGIEFGSLRGRACLHILILIYFILSDVCHTIIIHSSKI